MKLLIELKQTSIYINELRRNLLNRERGAKGEREKKAIVRHQPDKASPSQTAIRNKKIPSK
jgi:hypothetical protein